LNTEMTTVGQASIYSTEKQTLIKQVLY